MTGLGENYSDGNVEDDTGVSPDFRHEHIVMGFTLEGYDKRNLSVGIQVFENKMISLISEAKKIPLEEITQTLNSLYLDNLEKFRSLFSTLFINDGGKGANYINNVFHKIGTGWERLEVRFLEFDNNKNPVFLFVITPKVYEVSSHIQQISFTRGIYTHKKGRDIWTDASSVVTNTDSKKAQELKRRKESSAASAGGSTRHTSASASDAHWEI